MFWLIHEQSLIMSEADQSVGGAPKAAEPSRRQGRREATLVSIYYRVSKRANTCPIIIIITRNKLGLLLRVNACFHGRISKINTSLSPFPSPSWHLLSPTSPRRRWTRDVGLGGQESADGTTSAGEGKPVLCIARR